MNNTYFDQLNKNTETRMWINNPSIGEAKLALEQGAFSCTTNPAYCSKLLKTDKAGLDKMIDELIDEWYEKGDSFDYEEMTLKVYRKASKKIMKLFMPLYESSDHKAGFVTIQDDPRFDEDAEHMINNALINRDISPNYMAKIPVISGGIEAIIGCIKHNIPVCATEVFAVSQALHICRIYEDACNKYGNRPIMFITHISGIFDEYLGKKAKREGISISDDVLNKAGVMVARRQYKILKEKGYEITMLGGGARGLHHFTGLVGGPHITINWSTAEELLSGDFSVEEMIETKVDNSIIDELSEKFPEFVQAYEIDGLSVSEFATFGPVQLFRNSFINGWYLLQAEIASRRHARAL